MSDELNPQASSQSAAPAQQPAAEPNAVGKPAEPVATGGMTQSQASDYYNKTQQLAAERRALEAEKAQLAAQRNQGQPNVSTPVNPYANNGYPAGYNSQGQPVQSAQSYQPASPQNLIPPETAKALVDQFGFDGANAIVQVAQSITQPLLSKVSQTESQVILAQQASLEAQISATGADKYGADNWAKVKAPVMELIKTYGMPLDIAYKAISADQAAQRATEQAYQQINQKEQGNVAAQTAQPAGQQSPSINSFGDAFKAAMQQHSR